MRVKAATLEQALDVLRPEPLSVDDKSWYVARSEIAKGTVGPLALLRTKLKHALPNDKFFLSGHVGSGKSTELIRLAADPTITERYHVISFRFEEDDWAHLDSRQAMFRIAAEIYTDGIETGLLGENGPWEKPLRELSSRIYGPTGVQAKDGSVAVEYNLLFVKLRQELRLSEERRKFFRNMGETEQTLLRDLVDLLVDTLEDKLAKAEEPARLLLVIDDLDKVRDPELQKEVFDTNLGFLLAPKVTMLLTLPSSVLFRGTDARISQRITHLRPVGVLEQSQAAVPEDARLEDGIDLLCKILEARTGPEVFSDDAVRLAALYSGGVPRDFIHLLRQAVYLALTYEADKVDIQIMEDALRDARVHMSYGIYPPDFKALLQVHQSKKLPSGEQGPYLDRSWVLEYNGSDLWFDVNPLLWSLLSEPPNDVATSG